MKLVRQWELCSPQQAVYIITDLSSCSAHQPRACPSTVSSLALPSREIFHLLPNCTTRSWIHQTRYSLIITLKTLHHCALYSPQWILYTRAPYDPCTDLSALCKATVGEGGVVLGGGGGVGRRCTDMAHAEGSHSGIFKKAEWPLDVWKDL